MGMQTSVRRTNDRRPRTTRIRALAAAVSAAVLLVAPGADARASTHHRSTPPVDTAQASTSVNVRAGCSTRGWGARPNQVSRMTTATVRGVRAGRHACFDRLVVDVGPTRPAMGYSIRYVDRVISTADRVVPLRGAADLLVAAHAPAYSAGGKATYAPRNRDEAVDVRGYRTLRQVAFVESFEGTTVLGVGTRAKLPFRAMVLTQGARQMLVVDVAHRP